MEKELKLMYKLDSRLKLLLKNLSLFLFILLLQISVKFLVKILFYSYMCCDLDLRILVIFRHKIFNKIDITK